MLNFTDLAWLRHDPNRRAALGEAARRAREAWAARPAVAPILDDLATYGSGCSLLDCTTLDALFGTHSVANQFVDAWLADGLALLASNPLAQPEFAFQQSANSAVMRIASSGRAELSVVVFWPSESDAPASSVHFASVDRHEICLSGSASAVLATRIDARTKLHVERRHLRPGDRLVQRGNRDAKAYDSIEGCLAILRLSRRHERAQATCELALEDGRLIHRSTGEKADSRKEMAMALLTRMKRGDAVPQILDIARSGDPHLRWQALRNCLALDVRQGFDLLCTIAADDADSLCHSAGILRAQLIERYPQLNVTEDQRCPA